MPTDPRHGRTLPDGRRLARLLYRFRSRQGQEVLSRLRAGEEDVRLDHWLEPMQEAVLPLLLEETRQGGRQAVWRIRRLLERRRDRRNGPISRRWGESGGGVAVVSKRSRVVFGLAFDVFNPKVLNAVKQAAFAFCQSTLDTVTGLVQTAIQRAKKAVGSGLERGDTLRQLTRDVQAIFNDPAKALVIAQTEASRAMHAGEVMAAEASGVVKGLEWLASSDACPLCSELSGKQVPLGQPFAVYGTGPYGVISHPPRHPNCMCSCTEILKTAAEMDPA